jgi:hypothetical protein
MRKSVCALLVGLVGIVWGCSKPAADAPSTPPEATHEKQAETHAPAPQLSDAQLTDMKVNEAGVVPILEYHAIGPGHSQFDRSVEQFKQDLQRLYDEGYRPIALEDYLADKIDVPAGKSPVILTFDDARESQFRYLPNGELDPDCALGIMQAFEHAHPDFKIKATFYVLPLSAFGRHAEASKKMNTLLDLGFEIGNHTVSHNSLRKMTDEEVQKELANAVNFTHELAPKATIDTVALPMGIAPKNRALLASGTYNGLTYQNHAVLLVGADPAPSPASKKFKPMHLPRIQACEGLMGITYWLDTLKSHPAMRYISDGDPATVTVPKSKESSIDETALQGAHLRTY